MYSQPEYAEYGKMSEQLKFVRASVNDSVEKQEGTATTRVRDTKGTSD